MEDGLERRDGGGGERGSGIDVALVGALEIDGADLRRDGIESAGGGAAASDVGGVGEAREDFEEERGRKVVHGSWEKKLPLPLFLLFYHIFIHFLFS